MSVDRSGAEAGAGAGAGSRPRRRVGWIAFGAFWTAFAVLLAAPRVLLHRDSAGPASWDEALPIAILDMYSWALVALVALWLARRIPLDRARWAPAAAVHLAAGLGVLLVRFSAANAAAVGLGMIPAFPGFSVFLHILPFNLLFHFALVGVGYALEFHRRYRDRELEASQFALEASRLELAAIALEARLVEARLQTLKNQIQPHFLFNTLNAISTLVRHDPDAAERMITHLADLLRNTLLHRQHQEVTLGEELELLEPYLEIERTRFGERLTLEVHADPGALASRVPHLLLQPLIENSIRHGIAPQRGPGWISVTASLSEGALLLRVKDNGVGIDPAAMEAGGGIGLANIRARLTQLHGDAASLKVMPRRAGGTMVELRIPRRPAVELEVAV